MGDAEALKRAAARCLTSMHVETEQHPTAVVSMQCRDDVATLKVVVVTSE